MLFKIEARINFETVLNDGLCYNFATSLFHRFYEVWQKWSGLGIESSGQWRMCI